jgi:hypothetical protein
VDIVFDNKIAIEYERPGSHSFNELTTKRDAALSEYEQVFFVCQKQNYEHIKKAVGEERTIQRGKDLKEWIENRQSERIGDGGVTDIEKGGI